jgi:hypothetical protein
MLISKRQIYLVKKCIKKSNFNNMGLSKTQKCSFNFYFFGAFLSIRQVYIFKISIKFWIFHGQYALFKIF